eukprot:CAMPEP_0184383232 /NCGR_PEP_ID=MMETSP0007-20130409/6970_1 /TAXON_ID=97485 /ORGANISM="Prymnesium parvum, Strain Texoma1" /LENGTH=114 /DNA_ID=CAMNT_0026729619 /DNA_START=236 /DNA_END=581 /DNA_ORIENTATION=-
MPVLECVGVGPAASAVASAHASCADASAPAPTAASPEAAPPPEMRERPSTDQLDRAGLAFVIALRARVAAVGAAGASTALLRRLGERAAPDGAGRADLRARTLRGARARGGAPL